VHNFAPGTEFAFIVLPSGGAGEEGSFRGWGQLQNEGIAGHQFAFLQEGIVRDFFRSEGVAEESAVTAVGDCPAVRGGFVLEAQVYPEAAEGLEFRDETAAGGNTDGGSAFVSAVKPCA
jgi:hypothetical protein